ncbi:DUF1501 domain-containing protein [Caldimonas sp.]|uniref:DUF1501 domain-containing protein n=1 Tax=Caldimonas sp. TaxID=2838790 RepID=UPI0039188AF4
MKTHPPADAWALKRRQWLRFTGGTLASALGLGGLTTLLHTPAQAQSGYKALVCVFLYGGNDGMNTIVPTDTRYNQYASVRGRLALPRNALVDLGNSGYGLHPAMAALEPVWNQGHLAPVFNVGPLYAPLTKAEYRSAPPNSALIPEALFSHSDQQLLWEAASTNALTRTGWGGRAAETLATANPVISVGGNGRFGLSTLSAPLVLPGPGSTFGLEGLSNTSWAPVGARKAAIEALYAGNHPNALLDAYMRQQREALAVSDRLGALVKTAPADANASAAINQAFAPLISNGRISSSLGQQLYQVAKLIEGRATVQGERQIFFASLGGFDTHGNQIAGDSTTGEHARLLGLVAQAMACFHQAMINLGVAQNVTLFTQSDFGRTFKPNNSAGTDHAWGNHQLVMGGAVVGRTTYGSYPELVLGGPDDVGVHSWEQHGRWIPKISVDQYAATLLRWFGASDSQLDTILPNLRNFSQRQIGFL